MKLNSYFKTGLSIIMLLLGVGSVFSQNPIVPPGVYIADPSAHVWPDGKLYIYGSLDESPDDYCSHRHHVMVTGDLKSWDILKNRFASAGENDEVPYNDSRLYAPDCMHHDGTYYLYYCQPDPDAEGVATSPDPAGPFKDGQPIDTHGHNQIDPSVFIDDDGQAYYMWGQFTLKMAKLAPNMKELDPASVRDSVLTESGHYFHEGAYLAKRNGIYYMVYADLSRADMPTCIGYATSRFPMGPYTYGGVIVDNDQCNPGNWNNHGSIAEFKDQWIVFYHRSTHGSKMMRKACAEPITFNADGSIPEVEMTSQGLGEPLPAVERIDAERACLLQGNVRIRLFESGNEELGAIQHDDKAVFKYIDFGSGVSKVHIRVAPGHCGGTLQLKADMPWGPMLASVPIPQAESQKTCTTLTHDVKSISGVHALWLQFYSDDANPDWNMAVDWLRFESHK
ncbi:MAG: family 43 glycosylhydrolase [candidate division KSB1 bacterium]|nr:family 43 glycosylhydrolase [candidate division KSB1 bacterium]